MKEKIQLQVFLVFLFIVASMALAQASFASVVLTPAVAGYSASAGRFASAAGSFTMTAANDGYIAQSIVNVAGKAVTMPATLRMAANAGQIVKAGLSISPWGLLTTAALLYLSNGGIDFDANHNPVVSEVPAGSITVGSVYPSNWPAGTCAQPIGSSAAYQTGGGSVEYRIRAMSNPGGMDLLEACWDGSGSYRKMFNQSPCSYITTSYQCSEGTTRAATPSDYDALPDPLPALAPELPFAPYLPQGVPVQQPEYSPSDVPLGQPYTKPDGSTAQPRAKISPSGDGQVTVATYDQPLTDAQGQPVTNPTPQPTPDQPKDPCDDHPERLGCMPAGSDSFAVPTSSVPLSFTPESAPFSGTCPAPISVLGQSISFQSSCDAMTMIRPLVLAFAAVMAAFILLDTFRGAA